MTVLVHTQVWGPAGVVVAADGMRIVSAFAGTAAFAVGVAGGRGGAVFVVALVKAGASHAILEERVGKDGVPRRGEVLLLLLLCRDLRSRRRVGDAVSLAGMRLGETALAHGGRLGRRRMGLCTDGTVAEAVVVETCVVVDAGKGVQAVGEGHVDGEEAVKVQGHGGHVVGGGASKGQVRRVVVHDEDEL